jgi:hypothetical protein
MKGINLFVNVPFSPESYMDQLRCPLCHRIMERSDYLMNHFKDQPQVKWIAHIVTHYRHHHITWWNNCWGYGGNRYRKEWFGNYDDEKSKVNESSKRQIIRKGHGILRPNGVIPDHFMALHSTTDETMKVAIKYLNTII